MSKPHPQIPDLAKYKDKRLSVHLNGKRMVSGVLRGFDWFMNLVLEEAVEERSAESRLPIGTIVRAGWGLCRCLERDCVATFR